MNKKLTETIEKVSRIPIDNNRIEILNQLSSYIQHKIDQNQKIDINFICTHNSRRSHLGQVWMQTFAEHFNIKNLHAYSGGTEETAMAKPIVNTLIKQGFTINALSDNTNPVYAIKTSDNSLPMIGFSKKYNHSFNPTSGFAAIMTCSQADEGCPFVAGSDKRIPITYEDPKLYDNTDLQDEKYQERSYQIASEVYYILSQIKQ